MKEQTKYSELDRFYLQVPFIHKACNRRQQARAGLLLTAGIVLMVLPVLSSIGNDLVSILLIATGLFLFAGALVQCIRGCNRLVYSPTGKQIVQGMVTYDHAACPVLRSLIENGHCDVAASALTANPNGGIRMEYLLSQDHQMLAINVKRFENLMWLPLTEAVYLFTGKDAECAIESLGID